MWSSSPKGDFLLPNTPGGPASFRPALRRSSPLELRLAVALVALGRAPGQVLTPGVHHRALVERLLGSPEVSRELRKVVEQPLPSAVGLVVRADGSVQVTP